MKRGITLLNILFTGIVIYSCTSQRNTDTVYSEWTVQCRETEEYLYENKGNGALRFGKKPADDSYRWISEATSGKELRLKNKKTGHYLEQESDGTVVCKKHDGAFTNSALWIVDGFANRRMGSVGWYSIAGALTGDGKFLAQSSDSLCLQAFDPNKSFCYQWTFVREKGSEMPYAVYTDSVIDASFRGTKTVVAVSSTEIVSGYHQAGATWKLKADIAPFPQFTASNNTMLVALYNMALEETLLNVRTDTTFMAGKSWTDTWTRDAVYSIYFSLSWILPDISRKTLEKQTLKNPKEALQDTGSGGSWPISTDRVVWALAAWEYYLTTGDRQWLAEAYEGLGNTANKDIHVAFDPRVGLFKGETCSMDWRTHTYPNWFTNARIGESFSSGTNALHLFLYRFLGVAGKILNKNRDEIERWETIHALVKDGLNKYFWNDEKGLYACYLYPQYMDYRPSQRVGVMSNGLCALLGAASGEQARRIIRNYPLYPYGAAVLYPTIPDDYAYHNKSIWAVWQTPYMFAAKQAGNATAVEHIVKSQIRQGAMFLTHKENMTYDTGYDRNTAVNSDRQLWSVASFLSIIYRILFGMEMSESGIRFNPMIPADLIKGTISLTNFPYRNALLDVHISGTGNTVKSLKLNGEKQPLPFELSADASGNFHVEIEMTSDNTGSEPINLVEAGPGKCWSPVEPVLQQDANQLSWKQKPEIRYVLFGNGKTEAVRSPCDLSNRPAGFYSVYAIDKNGFESDLSNPVLHSPYIQRYEAEDAKYESPFGDAVSSYSGRGYVIDLNSKQANIEFTVDIPESGTYGFFITGSNGVAYHRTFCAIRSVFVDDADVGTFLLEATGRWNEWTESNCLTIENMTAGKHRISLKLNPENKGFDNNMSFNKENANDCYIDYLKVIKL